MMRAAVLAFAVLAAPAAAQDIAEATGARLRVLDKLTGQVTDVTLANGQSAEFGRIAVTLDGCRFPKDNPTAEAFVHLIIHDASAKEPVFNGWMVATSPALSALDHARYDVWPLRCDVPDLVLPEVEEAPEEEEAPAQDGETTDDGNG